MPPQLALLLCFAVIAVLFRMDRSERDTSLSLWIPTIWVMIMGSRMVSEWFSGGTSIQGLETYSEGSPLDRNIFIVLIVAGIATLIRKRISLGQAFRDNPWLMSLVCYAGLSLTWSDFPLVALKRYFKDIGDVVMAMLVLSERDPARAVGTVIKRCGFVLIPLSIVLYKYYPDLGRGYGRWMGELFVVGVTNNKNSLGALAMVCGIGLVWHVILKWSTQEGAGSQRRSGTIASFIVLAAILWTLSAARSATSIACFIIGCTIVIAAPLLARNRFALGVVALFAVLGIALVEATTGSAVGLAFNGLGRDATLTDRTDIWHDVLAFNTNPFIGVGFGSFWLGERLESLWQVWQWRPTEAHNGYLEVYLELGLLGLFLIGGCLVSALLKAFRSLRTDLEFARLQLAFLVVVVMYNITESAFRVDTLMYSVFLLVAMRLPQPEAAEGRVQPARTFARALQARALPARRRASSTPSQISPSASTRSLHTATSRKSRDF